LERATILAYRSGTSATKIKMFYSVDTRLKYLRTGKSTSVMSVMMLKPRSRYSRFVSVPEKVSLMSKL